MYPTTSLQRGSTGSEVKKLQDYLVSQGVMTQTQVNTGYGIYGPATEKAVLTLQQKLGVDNSTGPGQWGPRTIAAVSQPKTVAAKSIPATSTAMFQNPDGSYGVVVDGQVIANNKTAKDAESLKNTYRADFQGVYLNPTEAQQNTLSKAQEISQQNIEQTKNLISPTNTIDTNTANLESAVSTIPGLKDILDILRLQLDTKLQEGKRVNPDLTITPELTQKFIDQASKELDPYYQEQINQHKQDLSISFRQLQQDYTKDIERSQQPFQQALESQDITEANQGTAFSSGRAEREQQLIGEQQQKLDDVFTQRQRGVEKVGLASERAIGSRNFADLGIPSLQQYSAQRNIIAPRGEITPTGAPRSLYTPQGGLFGELPASQKVATERRVGELTTNEINKRTLDAGNLTRTI